MAIGAVDALEGRWAGKSLVAGINASREVMDLRSSPAISSAAATMTLSSRAASAWKWPYASIRKEIDPEYRDAEAAGGRQDDHAPFDQPNDKRECPTLAAASRRNDGTTDLNEPPLNLPELTVSELSGRAQAHPSRTPTAMYAFCAANLGKVSYHSNGHVYFDLKGRSGVYCRRDLALQRATHQSNAFRGRA